MKRIVLSMMAGLLLAPFIFSGTSDATVFGGKFVRSGVFTLNFNYGGAHRYYGNVWQGGANWSATPTDVNIGPWGGLPALIHIDVIDVNTGDTWWGMTTFNPCPGSGCNYVKNTFYLNQRTLDPESDFTRTKVATHEFGHTIGLAHPSGTATSIMNQGYQSFNTPRTYDINDVNWLY